MRSELFRALLTILAGGIAGGLTNTVAVWMLFHPYVPPRLGPFRLLFLHGAIPKNQARLASAVGRTVGHRLLTQEDLARILGEPEFRRAFEHQISGFLTTLLDQEYDSIERTLPPEDLESLISVLEEWGDHLLHRLQDWMESPEFERIVEDGVRDALQTHASRPIREWLTEERAESLVATLEKGWGETVRDERFQGALEQQVERLVHSTLREGQTLEDLLPAGLPAFLERALAHLLPAAAQRVGRILEDPAARARVQRALHNLLQRFVQDLRFHQRWMARLMITEETLARILATVEEEGAEHLAEMFRDPEVEKALSQGIHEALQEGLRRPLVEWIGHPDDPAILQASARLHSWLVGIAQSPNTQTRVSDLLRGGLERVARRTWAEVLPAEAAQGIAQTLVRVLRQSAPRERLQTPVRRALRGALQRPIGKLSRWIPGPVRDRIGERLSVFLWQGLQNRIPEGIQALDVARRVEEKVMQFPTEELEALVRRVTEQELRLIVRLGYLLGAFIGALLVGLDAVL